jgi:hypothetical protein
MWWRFALRFGRGLARGGLGARIIVTETAFDPIVTESGQPLTTEN